MTDAEDQPSATLSPSDARRLMRLVDQLGDAVRAASPTIGEPVGSTAQELLELSRRWQRASGRPLLRVSQALKRDGFIDVPSDPEDKRYLWAVLTQAGRDSLRGLLER